jgi:hypothetical protein
MPAEALFVLVLLALGAASGVALVVRAIAGASFDRSVARFERNVAFPPLRADERR